VNDYIVIAESAASLRSIINFYSAGRTLMKDKHYLKFAESLSEKTIKINTIIYFLMFYNKLNNKYQ
jgi:hypothetical protein